MATGCASIGLGILFSLVIFSKKRITKGVLTLYVSKTKSNK